MELPMLYSRICLLLVQSYVTYTVLSIVLFFYHILENEVDDMNKCYETFYIN